MKIVSVALLVVALALGALAYRQHQAFRRVDAERFSLNANGTVNVELFGPGVRKTDSAKTTRNLLIAGCAVSAIVGVGCFIGSIRKQKGSGV